MTIFIGDSLTWLKKLPSESVHCIVTSPPYYGLRDYGIAGQIGLEETPEMFIDKLVTLFREARRVLRADGTCWVNMGDSYNSDGTTSMKRAESSTIGMSAKYAAEYSGNWKKLDHTLKPKDLMMMPARLALALQEPYYTGVIKQEKDRTWLAALVDGEGSFGIRRQKSSGNRNQKYNDTYIPYMTIKMSDREPLDYAVKITGLGSVRAAPEKVGTDKRNVRTVRTPYIWRLDGNKAVQIAKELYPYLLVKKRQAACLYTLDVSNKDKKRGRGNTVPNSVIEFRTRIFEYTKAINQRKTDDIPSWLLIPPSLTEPGWFLRSDIIWHKPNPMPESVTDRPTKSHEHIFLLAKSERYWYDADAIRENAVEGKDLGILRSSKVADLHTPSIKTRQENGVDSRSAGSGTRNKRDVWTIPTQAFPEAHFATFPMELAATCIKAGCPETVCSECGAGYVAIVESKRIDDDKPSENLKLQSAEVFARGGNQGTYGRIGNYAKTHHGYEPACTCNAATDNGVVLDPFGGAGTTAIAAVHLGRKYQLIELNPRYVGIAQKRIADYNPFQDTVLPDGKRQLSLFSMEGIA